MNFNNQLSSLSNFNLGFARFPCFRHHIIILLHRDLGIPERQANNVHWQPLSSIRNNLVALSKPASSTYLSYQLTHLCVRFAHRQQDTRIASLAPSSHRVISPALRSHLIAQLNLLSVAQLKITFCQSKHDRRQNSRA
jgi:hypothetical protein